MGGSSTTRCIFWMLLLIFLIIIDSHQRRARNLRVDESTIRIVDELGLDAIIAAPSYNRLVSEKLFVVVAVRKIVHRIDANLNHLATPIATDVSVQSHIVATLD